MNMGTPHPSKNQGKILKSHGIKRVNHCQVLSVLVALWNKYLGFWWEGGRNVL